MGIFYKLLSISHNNFVLLFFYKNAHYAIKYILSPLFSIIIRQQILERLEVIFLPYGLGKHRLPSFDVLTLTMTSFSQNTSHLQFPTWN